MAKIIKQNYKNSKHKFEKNFFARVFTYSFFLNIGHCLIIVLLIKSLDTFIGTFSCAESKK